MRTTPRSPPCTSRRTSPPAGTSWLNRRIPGLWIVALGAASNGIAIAVNGGTLPASRTALETAGIHLEPGEFLNSGVLEHPHLGFLGDVFAIPAGFPLANVFWVGDVLIVLGVAWGAHRVCGSRLGRTVAGPGTLRADTLSTTPAAAPTPPWGRAHERRRGRHRPAGGPRRTTALAWRAARTCWPRTPEERRPAARLGGRHRRRRARAGAGRRRDVRRRLAVRWR